MTVQLHASTPTHTAWIQELEATVQLKSCDLTDTVESDHWSTAITGYKLFRRDRQGRRGGGGEVALKAKRKKSALTAQSCVWKTAISRLGDHWWKKSEVKPTKKTSWLLLTTGCPIKRMLPKNSYFNYKKHHACRLRSCWETSVTLKWCIFIYYIKL